MLYLLLGKDYFAKQDFLKNLAQGRGLPIARKTATSAEDLLNLAAASLFSIPEISVIEQVFNISDFHEAIKRLHESAEIFAVIEEKIDKRKTDNAEILKLSELVVKEFAMPHQTATLVDWVWAHAQQQKVRLSRDVAQELVNRLGYSSMGFNTPEPDPWQFHNELEKLRTYANNQEVTVAMVKDLIVDQTMPQVWNIVEAMGQRKPVQVVLLLQAYLAADTQADEKAKVIQLSALLADQFRNLLLVKSAGELKIPDQDILDKTGWKSGRLGVLKKNAQAFSVKNLTDTLAKFEALDMELKSSSVPPRVLIDLISSQI